MKYIVSIILLSIGLLVNAQDKKSEIATKINSLSVNTDKATYEKLLKEYVQAGGDIKAIQDGILKPVNSGNSTIVPIIETIVLPSQSNNESLLDYYYVTGVSLGAFCNNPTKAIEYLNKAIEIADKKGLEKKIFSSAGGQLTHAWGNVAVNYERLGDFKNSAVSYLKAAKEIKKYYPINTKEFNDFLGISSYMMYKYLSESYKGKDAYGEYFPYLMEYAEVGNLNGLSALWNYFIDKHDTSGLNMIEADIIPNEKDKKAIGEFYWAAAEQFLHDELYQDAIGYNLFLITHAKINNLPEYLFDKWDDNINHSRFEMMAYCYDKLGDDENFVQSILNALNDVGAEYGPDSESFKYYSDFLYVIMDNPEQGPILQRKLNEMGY